MINKLKNCCLNILLVMFALSLFACSNEEPNSEYNGNDTLQSSTEINVSSPAYGVYQILKVSGSQAEVVGAAKESAIKTNGYELRINGNASIDLLEFGSSDSLISFVKNLSSDGKKINNTEVNWGGTPHFFKTDRVLIKYIGDDKAVISLLENIAPQFAGGTN